MRILKIGALGEDVRALQKKLNLIPDGIFGPITEECVKAYQKAHGLAVDGIVGPRTWNVLNGSAGPITRHISEIIVHCSATPEGKDFTVAQIRQWHLARGFRDIGYHYVIYRDGSIHTGRALAITGAHCTGHNTHSIGVCYIGGCAADGKTPKDTRTQAQRVALTSLLRRLKAQFPNARIYGHKDFANKACPCFDAKTEYKTI